MAFRDGTEPHVHFYTEIVGPSMTKQSFKDECDINTIMARYEKDGVVTHVKEHEGQYGDFTLGFDYHDAMNRVHAARDMFMSLPAGIRTKFDNDPGKFLDFVSDPKNSDAMVEMGLKEKAPVPAAVPPVPVPDATPAA